MSLLLIDTSTERGLVGFVHEDTLIFSRELPFGSLQSRYLIPLVEECLASCPQPVTYIGLGVGPGSYTGIRMGVAAAQGLAYSWKVPLVPLSSLQGFIPSEWKDPFAVIVDARMGGIYLQRGFFKDGIVQFDPLPVVCSIEEAEEFLKEIDYIVSPSIRSLQEKFLKVFPTRTWKWEERGPVIEIFAQEIKKKIQEGAAVNPLTHLDIYYLRETQAERVKRSSKNDSILC